MIAVRIRQGPRLRVAASREYLESAWDARDGTRTCVNTTAFASVFPSGQIIPWRFSRAGGVMKLQSTDPPSSMTSVSPETGFGRGFGILYHAEMYLGPLIRKKKLNFVVRELNAGRAGKLFVLS